MCEIDENLIEDKRNKKMRYIDPTPPFNGGTRVSVVVAVFSGQLYWPFKS